MCGTENQAATNGTTKHLSSPSSSTDVVLNLDHGDPTVYESYWKRIGEKCTVVIKGSELMSYISDVRKPCWFLEEKFESVIKRLHRLTGNAVVDDRYVVVGTGSTQLFQALLYAITTTDASLGGTGGGPDQLPVPVVCAAPYYSQYAEETDYLRSGLYKWAGDAYAFDKDGPYIEVVTSPNNPDGTTREAVVIHNGDQGKVLYDMAYYWPQYTPITRPADHDIMYFTFSKSTGHAGSRIGWALVKDEAIARKMTKFIELSSIGVSKDSQIRAAKIMEVICEDYQDFKHHQNSNHFFEYARKLMENRWKRLREVVARSNVFSLPKYSQEYCLFHGECTESYPAFAWLKCKEEGVEDCEKLLQEYKILGRGGKRFGSDPSYARVSILSREEVFQQFLERLEIIKGNTN
ncbi:L-tryptophan--pyruvate aminotransferase 1 [Humulus lupulus]|uniref:L-tryptophan--pyruvate aminotransferase 1 n=1 Tax=Humulus lupulus TaxID=3486 RepID=UPI002B417EFB|nr:L-tryptophan--pyruvate aminotransferase 1 [Humulus lupulus]